jgi:hypothetical protein
MRKRTSRRKAPAVVALTLVTFALGVTLAVFVAGSASALGPPSSTTSASSTTANTTSTSTTKSPADQFLSLNGSVSAASDHEIVASSAFPNFTTGAVDNYYSMSKSHVDNSPFAEGTASPADTGPVGQTAAAGNFQQPQYADARWPGGPDKQTYGSQGGPFAEAAADTYLATADASEPSRGLSSPSLRAPNGFNSQLQRVLAAWKATWLNRLVPKQPTPAVTTPKGTTTVPKAPVTPPATTVTTPIGTVTTPRASATGGSSAPPAAVQSPTPPPTVPPVPRRSMSSASTSKDGESLLESSTFASLVPLTDIPKTDTIKTNTTTTDTSTTGTTTTTSTTSTTKTDASQPTYALVTSGESRLGRVTLGGGQIVIEGIHVKASIANDGDPGYSASVSVTSASIGGIPVTIDEKGVHVAGHTQGVDYKKASDALNSALKQAGIQLFLVGPEVTLMPTCDQTGMSSGSGTDTGTTTGSTTTTTSTSTTATTPSDSSGMTSSCDQSGMNAAACDQTATGTGTTTTGATTTTASPATPLPGQSTTTTTTSSQTDTTSTASPCTGMATGTTSTCSATGAATGTTTPLNSSTGTTTTPSSNDQFGASPATPSSGEVIITATGLHVVFTQPVSPSGVPAQYIEHILGEVLVDSLATPQGPIGALPNLGFNSPSGSSAFSASSSSPSSSSCLGGGHSGSSLAGGSSLTGGTSGSSGSLSPSASSFGSTSQPSSSSSSTGNSLPAAFASALRKPLWLLLGYLLWQSLVVGTALSLWNWRRGGAT